ncbi:MAG: hypothetical protein EHM40_02745 [Chloroflexi bacterium]|nr:MAG: hypothetical protein EHM40_02745 [Chloroflexota bacterium]
MKRDKFKDMEERLKQRAERDKDLPALAEKVRQAFPDFTEAELKILFPALARMADPGAPERVTTEHETSSQAPR